MTKPGNAKTVRAGTYTVCLDTNKADMDTYMNWTTFRLIRVRKGYYAVERKSNAAGNGQCWDASGSIDGTDIRITGLDPLTVMAGTVLARYFGLCYANEVKVGFRFARVFRPRGRKTAAPSLLRVNVRDKNVKAKRWNAMDVHAAHATQAARNAIDAK